VQINVFILSSHGCLFDAVLQYPHVASNCLSRQLLPGGMQRCAVDMGAALTTKTKTYLRFHQRTLSTTCVIQPNGQPIKYEN